MKKIIQFYSIIVISLAPLLFSSDFAFAQESSKKINAIEAIRAFPLDSTRYGIMVHFTEEGKENAQKLGPMVAEALQYYRDSLGVDLDFRLALLDEKSWKEYTNYPYGLPFVNYDSSPAVAVLPEKPEGAVYELLLGLEDEVSADLRKQVENTGYNWKDFSAKVVNLIIFHEIGHPYANTYGIAKPAKWLNEFVASYFAYTFIYAAYPESAHIWKLSGDAIFQGHEPTHRTLKEFEELYDRVGVPDYGWYQSAFEKRANPLVEKRGVSFIRDLKEAFPEGTGNLTNGEIIAKLEKIESGFKEWSKIFEEK